MIPTSAQPRRLARSSHLHTIAADRLRHKLQAEDARQWQGEGPVQTRSDTHSPLLPSAELSPYPSSGSTERYPDNEEAVASDDGGASASEIDSGFRTDE